MPTDTISSRTAPKEAASFQTVNPSGVHWILRCPRRIFIAVKRLKIRPQQDLCYVTARLRLNCVQQLPKFIGDDDRVRLFNVFLFFSADQEVYLLLPWALFYLHGVADKS